MSTTGTDVRVPKAGSAGHRITENPLAARWRQLRHRWPMAVISLGVISSFVWAVVLVWLLLGLINRLV
jgi:hypothetical protein